MKAALLSVLAVVAFAASVLVISERLRPPATPEPPPAAPAPQPTTDPAVLRRLAAIEASLKRIAEGLRSSDESESRSADSSPQIGVGRRLAEIETQLFDFERSVRRELRLLYDKTRQRMDEMEAKLEGLTSKPATPVDRATLRAELLKQGVDYDAEAKRFEVRGVVGHPTRELEFIATAPGGKSHESLFVLDVIPSAMKRAAIDMGLKPGEAADFRTMKPPQGDGLYTYVSWEARPTPIRIEKLVRNIRTGGTLKAGPLVFIGSRTFIHDQTWDPYFAADVYKNVIGLTWNFSGDTVFTASDEAGEDQYIWAPDVDLLPLPQTRCKLIFLKEPVAEWDR